MKKHILAMVLTLAMLLSMLPVQVFAAEPANNGGVHTEQSFEPMTTDPVVEPSAQDEEAEPTEAGPAETTPPKRNTASHFEHDSSDVIVLNDLSQLSRNEDGDYVFTEGSYVLDRDIYLYESIDLIFDGKVDLCFNGCGIYMISSPSMIRVEQGAVVNFFSCKVNSDRLYEEGGFSDQACVLLDPDSTNTMKNLALIGYFSPSSCEKVVSGRDGEDGICYHTSTGLVFSS